MKLKIVTFNICHGLGIDGSQHLSRTIELLRSSGADIIHLQEVDRHFGARSGWEDQPALLAEALGMDVAYGANLDLEPVEGSSGKRRQYGTAILSRYPITYSTNHRLPQVVVPGAFNEPRGLLEAHIDAEGNAIRLFNTHLGLRREERTKQTEFMLELLRSTTDTKQHLVVTGDFNAEPSSEEIGQIGSLLRDAYAEAHGGRHANTLLTSDGGSAPIAVRCIDYIFVSSGLRVSDAEVIDTNVSDHLPVVAVLETEAVGA